VRGLHRQSRYLCRSGVTDQVGRLLAACEVESLEKNPPHLACRPLQNFKLPLCILGDPSRASVVGLALLFLLCLFI
jgi:hypothetical protein